MDLNKVNTMFYEDHIVTIIFLIELEMLIFAEGGKPSKQRREPTTTLLTYDESNPGHSGERRALSPLRRPRALHGSETETQRQLVNRQIISTYPVKNGKQ
jgi:hypothetical protein